MYAQILIKHIWSFFPRVFSNCSKHVNLIQTKNNCKFDSCRTGVCSSLEQAAEECKIAGFCIKWRELMSGRCSNYILSAMLPLCLSDFFLK